MVFSVPQLSPVAGGICPWWIQLLGLGACVSTEAKEEWENVSFKPVSYSMPNLCPLFLGRHLKAEKAFFSFWAKSCILLQAEVLWKSMGVLCEQRLQDEVYNPVVISRVTTQNEACLLLRVPAGQFYSACPFHPV